MQPEDDHDLGQHCIIDHVYKQDRNLVFYKRKDILSTKENVMKFFNNWFGKSKYKNKNLLIKKVHDFRN